MASKLIIILLCSFILHDSFGKSAAHHHLKLESALMANNFSRTKSNCDLFFQASSDFARLGGIFANETLSVIIKFQIERAIYRGKSHLCIQNDSYQKIKLNSGTLQRTVGHHGLIYHINKLENSTQTCCPPPWQGWNVVIMACGVVKLISSYVRAT